MGEGRNEREDRKRKRDGGIKKGESRSEMGCGLENRGIGKRVERR